MQNLNNGLKWAIPGAAVILLCVAWMGARRSQLTSAPRAKPAVSTQAYPAPQVEILAQPMSYRTGSVAMSESDGYPDASGYGRYEDRNYPSDFRDEEPVRPKRHHRHTRKHREKTRDDDADLGFMAADDPKLLDAQSHVKPKKEDWKDWVSPGDGSDTPPEGF